MISTVIHINNRMYEQYLEKWSTNAPVVVRKNNKWEESWIQEHYKDYDLQSMNLNMTQRCSKQEKELRCF